jgi:hypothetical protein
MAVQSVASTAIKLPSEAIKIPFKNFSFLYCVLGKQMVHRTKYGLSKQTS